MESFCELPLRQIRLIGPIDPIQIPAGLIV